ncbi:MAG: hypothetical protein ACI97A_003754 [Planctomycetota bacterium]|jgi:hypothetical protein
MKPRVNESTIQQRRRRLCIILSLTVAMAASFGFISYRIQIAREADSSGQHELAMSWLTRDNRRAKIAAIAARGAVGSSPQTAMALALMSYDLRPNIPALEVMQETLVHDTLRIPFDGSERRFLSFTPDEQFCLFYRVNKISIRKKPVHIELWNIAKNELVGSIESNIISASRYAPPKSLISDDGRHILLEGEGPRGIIRVEIWDLQTLTQVEPTRDLGSIPGKPHSKEDSGIRNGAYWHYRYDDHVATVISFQSGPQIGRTPIAVHQDFDPELNLIPLPSKSSLAVLNSSGIQFFSLNDGTTSRTVRVPFPFGDTATNQEVKHAIVDCDDEHIVVRTEQEFDEEDDTTESATRGYCVIALESGNVIWREKTRSGKSIVDGPFLHAESRSFYLLRDHHSLQRSVLEKHDLRASGETIWTYQETGEVYGIEVGKSGIVAIAGKPQLVLVDAHGQCTQKLDNSMASDERSLGTSVIALFDGVHSTVGSGWGPMRLPTRAQDDGTPYPRDYQRAGNSLIVKHGDSGHLDLINLSTDEKTSLSGYDRVIVSTDKHPTFLLINTASTELWHSTPPRKIRGWPTAGQTEDIEAQFLNKSKLALIRSNGTKQGVRRLVSLESGNTVERFVIPNRAYVHPHLPLIVYRNSKREIVIWDDGKYRKWSQQDFNGKRMIGVGGQPPVVRFLEEKGPTITQVHGLTLDQKMSHQPIEVPTKYLWSVLTHDHQRLLSLDEKERNGFLCVDGKSIFNWFVDSTGLESSLIDARIQVHLVPSDDRKRKHALVRHALPIGLMAGEKIPSLSLIQYRNIPALYGEQQQGKDTIPVRWPINLVSYIQELTKTYPTDTELGEFGLLSSESKSLIAWHWKENFSKKDLLAALHVEKSLSEFEKLGALRRARRVDEIDYIGQNAESLTKRPFGIAQGRLVFKGKIMADQVTHAQILIRLGQEQMTKNNRTGRVINIQLANARLSWVKKDYEELLSRLNVRLKAELLRPTLEDQEKSDELLLMWYASLVEVDKLEAAETLKSNVGLYRPDLFPRINTLRSPTARGD